MAATVRTRPGLTGNQLKILAMIAMTCDHVGLQLLPQLGILRVIGRLALPVYAYMIAEGCRHTHDKKQYLLRMVYLALLCQTVYFVAMGSLYQCILVTFSLSICLIYLTEHLKNRGSWDFKGTCLFYGAAATVFFVCEILPNLLPNTDFYIDYGISGVLLPVMIYGGSPIGGLTLGLVLLGLQHGGIQWLALVAVPLLMLYNGQRGKRRLGKLFYVYYPLHLVVIYGLSLLF